MTDLSLIILLQAAMLFGIWCALIAHDKGTSLGVGFTLGALLGPVGVLLSAFGRSERASEVAPTGPPPRLQRTEPCPKCGRRDKAGADFCTACGTPRP